MTMGVLMRQTKIKQHEKEYAMMSGHLDTSNDWSSVAFERWRWEWSIHSTHRTKFGRLSGYRIRTAWSAGSRGDGGNESALYP